MPVRRHADPNNVQYIWDAIRSAKFHNQTAELSKITKFLQSESYCTLSQAELYVSQTLKDGLIDTDNKSDPKSIKSQPEIEVYNIPEQLTTPPDDGKDWYCIECHLAGDVTPCKHCHRVFHAECSKNVRYKQVVFQSIEKHNATFNNSTISANLSNDNSKISEFDKFIYDESVCCVCNLQRLDGNFVMDKEELNLLLSFILHRIRSWLPSNLTQTMAPDQKYEWTDTADLNWRAAQLFYQPMDMNVMELKLQSKEYTKLVEFIADVMTIQHNVAIFHGIESQEYGAAELMIRDTCYDISELKTCVDCYRHSNEKINSKWFCFPCRKPHKLVWAKQKGYPFWPAKIIKETESNYDVRFFGGKYERSVLPKNKKNILPIETKLKGNEIKKSLAFNKAVEELKLHQQFLGNPNTVKKYLNQNSLPKKQSTNPEVIGSKKPNIVTESTRASLDNAEQTSTVPKKRVFKRKSAPATSIGEVTPNKTRKNSTSLDNKQSPSKPVVQEIIPISDAEDDELLTVDHYGMGKSSDGCYGQVSSSTEYFMANDDGFHSHDISHNVMHPLEQPYSDAVEKMRRKLEEAKDKKQLISIAMDCMQQEIDKITNENNEHLKKLYDAHQVQISETKKKQWCYNCEQDAIYHCCWNTAYCSPTCQQQHWQAEHKIVCRRKR